MKFFFFALLFSQTAFASSDMKFMTSDGNTIAANFFANAKSKRIIVVAPGFAQNKNSSVMVAICQGLTKNSNVLCFDFRGTGNSTGTYVFGAKEYLDLEPILRWTHAHYKTVNLLGLSLGAYSSVRAAHEWPDLVSKLLLISCPTSLEDIILSGGPLADSFQFLLHPDNPELHTGVSWNFHWGYPLEAKPNLKSLAPDMRIPAAFFVGGEDHLVKNTLSRAVHDAIAGHKSWDEMIDGDHAEAMYVQHPEAFLHWIEAQEAN